MIVAQLSDKGFKIYYHVFSIVIKVIKLEYSVLLMMKALSMRALMIQN